MRIDEFKKMINDIPEKFNAVTLSIQMSDDFKSPFIVRVENDDYPYDKKVTLNIPRENRK